MARGVPLNEKPFSWDSRSTAKAIREYLDGKSATEIAPMIGPGVTRNAVIGLLHRNGVTRSHDQATKATTRDLQNRARNMARSKHKSPKPEDVKAIEAPPPPPPPAPRVKTPDVAVAREPLRITLMELESQSCRWIVTTGAPWLYCGHKVKGANNLDTPYCAHHTALAHPNRMTSLERATRPGNVIRAADGFF